jgi:lipopolysaccharide export system permease protein
MLKNKIFQYFFTEFFKIFLLISLSFSLLIWFTQAARLLELITEFGNPVSVYFKYLLFSYPKILQNTFLLNFIISMFFLFAKLNDAKEFGIYWLSGINKFKIYSLCMIIGAVVLVLNLILSIFLAPWSSYQGRLVLGESKFTLVNALVKEKNFNTPLKGLTIYVESNDKKGNLNGIFIYEKSRIITAQKGRVLTDGDNSYLELFNGTSQEKNNKKINFINFNSTIFDFSKYQLRNTSYPKFTERKINWLFERLKNTQISMKNRIDLRVEINSRLIKPFVILIVSTLICFLLFTNNDKINLKKLRIIIYVLSVSLLIINQIMLNLSGKNITYTMLYIFSLILFFIVTNFIFFKFIKGETK